MGRLTARAADAVFPVMSEAPRFHVTYRITPDDPRPVEAHAKDICIEETVEIPEDCVPKSHWEQGIVGRIENIAERKGDPKSYDVDISYRTDIANDQIPNLLNVLFGNIPFAVASRSSTFA